MLVLVSFDPVDIEALTAAAATGERSAVEALLVHYLPQVRAFVRLRTGEAMRARESSSDIVQSVCREILGRAESFRHPEREAFRRWLFTTALRKVKDHQAYHLAARRDLRREHVGQESQPDIALLQAYSSMITPSRAAVAVEELELLERAMDTLDDTYREVITLSRVVGLSHASIGEQLGKSPGAVRMLLHRGLAQLVAAMEQMRRGGES